MSRAKWKYTPKHLVALMLLAYTIAALYRIGYRNNVVSPENLIFFEQQHETTLTENGTIQGCNLFSGKWVYDDVSYPLYKEGNCALIEEDFACEKNGRKNLKYQNWRWQPHHCDLPRFNGKALLEKLRDKKLVFVGDSLCRNQWISMLCLTEPYFPTSTNKTVYDEGNFLNLHVKEYNATFKFYWSPLLVESNGDDLFNHSNIRDRIIRVTSIENHARHWTDADILIFDAFMWWLKPTMTLVWGPFGSSDAIYKTVKKNMRLRVFEMTLNTWSDWLEFNINRSKTKLFFMSISPYHSVVGNNRDDGGYCYNQTEPVLKDGHWGVTTDKGMMNIVESILHKLKTRGLNVTYLNITNLSDYRKDGHPSIYRPLLDPMREELSSNPRRIYPDCIHWCLPGVADVWNEILYSYIVTPQFHFQ